MASQEVAPGSGQFGAPVIYGTPTGANQSLSLQDAIGKGMNFGQWLAQVPGYGAAPTTPATSTQINGLGGWNYMPGGTGNGAVFNSGLSTDYNTINGIHQTGINDYNALAAARGMAPMAMSNVDLSGNGSTTGPGGTSQAPSWGGDNNSMNNAGSAYGGPMHGRPGAQPQSAAAATPAAPSSPAMPSYLGYNPGLAAQIGNLGQLYAQNFQRNILPSIDRSSIMAGGYGGTKNGVAEGVAAGDSMNGFIRSATDLLGQDWTNQQNRNLTNQGQQMDFYTAQRGQDLSQAGLGASLYGQGVMGPWGPLQAANGIYGNYTGFGQNTTSQGGGAMGALGGALGGSIIAKNLGWG